MTSVVDLIRADHDAVEKMFEDYWEMNSHPDKRHHAEKICAELDKHANAEEEKVYQHISEDIREHSIEEHDKIREAIDMIKSGEGLLDDHMHKLEDAVKHHVAEEEDKLLPELEARGPEVLESLGAEFEEAKK